MDHINNIEEQIENLRKENQTLRTENAELRTRIGALREIIKQQGIKPSKLVVKMGFSQEELDEIDRKELEGVGPNFVETVYGLLYEAKRKKGLVE